VVRRRAVRWRGPALQPHRANAGSGLGAHVSAPGAPAGRSQARHAPARCRDGHRPGRAGRGRDRRRSPAGHRHRPQLRDAARGEARTALAGPLIRGRAEILPFRSDSFDMLSMGFALRHVEDLEIAFGEYRRVLKPGGRVLLLEVSRPKSRIMRWVIRMHFQRVLPWLTRISTRSEPAELLMKYYWDTIDQCVSPDTILDVLRRNGFVDVTRRVYAGFLSEYIAAKSGKSAPSPA